MGFVHERQIINLEFASDHQWAGLEVCTHSLTTGAFQEVIGLASLFVDGKKATDLKGEDLAKLGRLFELFAEALQSWNLEKKTAKGKIVAVPANIEGVRSQDVMFMLELVNTWVTRIGGVSAELGKDSSSGATFPERSIPMAALSPSPPSSTVPS